MAYFVLSGAKNLNLVNQSVFWVWTNCAFVGVVSMLAPPRWCF